VWGGVVVGFGQVGVLRGMQGLVSLPVQCLVLGPGYELEGRVRVGPVAVAAFGLAGRVDGCTQVDVVEAPVVAAEVAL